MRCFNHCCCCCSCCCCRYIGAPRLATLAVPLPVPPSEQSLARQLEFPGRLAGLEAALGDADALAVAELKLFLVRRPGAGAVVREVDACCTEGCPVLATRAHRGQGGLRNAGVHTEGVWAEILVAVGAGVLGAVGVGVAGDVLGLVVLLMAAAAAAKHLVEEAELGGDGTGEGDEQEGEGEEAHRGRVWWSGVCVCVIVCACACVRG